MPHGDAFDAQVEQEFVEETRDILSELDVVIGQLSNESEEGKRRFAKLLKDLGSLRGAGRYSGFPLLAVTVHRLYDYLAGLDLPSSEQVQDVLTFADVLNGILDGEISHDANDLSEFVRSLPVRRPFDVEDIAHLDIEIMVVEPQRATAHIIERELQNCGYRVVNVHSALDAMALAVRTRPDMVIASATLDELSGVDLACAFSAMPSTKSMPVALLTSFDVDDARLKDLPDGAMVIQKGSKFGQGLSEALTRFGIT